MGSEMCIRDRLWIALNAKQNNVELPKKKIGLIPDMIHKLVSCIAEKLAKYLAVPDCEDVVGHMLEDVGGGVAELAFGERVDGDAFSPGTAVKA